MKLISDPLYGDISFEENESFIFDLIKTITFQRTRNLKQLGLCYRTFDGAVQTRFSHGIGAFYLVKKMLTRSEFQNQLTLKQINTIKVAALLHDVGHGPHSHGFEWYLKELGYKEFEHEHYSSLLIEDNNSDINKILVNNDINPNDVSLLIHGKNPTSFPNWTSGIVSSQIDVDRLDYLLRDEYFSLQPTNNTQNLIHLIDKVHIDKKANVLYYKQESVRLINDFLYKRYKMYEELYLKNEVNNWYRLVILILLEAKKLYMQKHVFKDEFNLFHLYENMFNNKAWSYKEYLKLDDQTFDLFLKSLSFESKKLKELYFAYETGDFSILNDTHLPKKISFYQLKKPIYILQEKNNKLVPYEESQDFSKIFKINS